MKLRIIHFFESDFWKEVSSFQKIFQKEQSILSFQTPTLIWIRSEEFKKYYKALIQLLSKKTKIGFMVIGKFNSYHCHEQFIHHMEEKDLDKTSYKNSCQKFLKFLFCPNGNSQESLYLKVSKEIRTLFSVEKPSSKSLEAFCLGFFDKATPLSHARVTGVFVDKEVLSHLISKPSHCKKETPHSNIFSFFHKNNGDFILDKEDKIKKFINNFSSSSPQAIKNFLSCFTTHAIKDKKSCHLSPLRDPKSNQVFGVIVFAEKSALPYSLHPPSPYRERERETLDELSFFMSSFFIKSQEKEFQKLFLSSVMDSYLYMIEIKDPSLRKHSERVALMTEAFACYVNKTGFATISQEEIFEMRCSGLLHDIGKIGSPDPILHKEKKMFPEEIKSLLSRLELKEAQDESYALKQLLSLNEKESPRSKKSTLKKITDVKIKSTTDFEIWQKESLKKYSKVKNLILSLLEPSILEEDCSDKVAELIELCEELNFPLSEEEIEKLSLKKGSLTNDERKRMARHVDDSYEILRRVLWQKPLAQMPELVYCHHERLNGKGYPRKIKKIPLGSQLLIISDIYDALSANDRSYKKGLPHDKVIHILKEEAKQGGLDPELISLFIKGEIFKKSQTTNQ